MNVRILDQNTVKELLSVQDCIPVMEDTLSAVSNGETILPLRPSIQLPEQNVFCMMPSFMGPIQSMGVKVISVFPKNHGTQYDAHQGVVLVFESKQGCLQAIVDATSITAIRTPAVSGLATKLLANPGASRLAMLGAGTQAQGHLDAMLAVRPIKEIRLWSLPLDKAAAFAELQSKRLDIDVQVMDSVEEAVRGAEIICTTTSAKEPFLDGDWLSEGVHINAVGSSVPNKRELKSNAVVRSRLFVDRKESTLNEAGDYLFPMREGLIDETHIQGEIGDILTGKINGRSSEKEITLFKSLGLAVEDLASAKYVYDKARREGLGVEVDIGGKHFLSS